MDLHNACLRSATWEHATEGIEVKCTNPPPLLRLDSNQTLPKSREGRRGRTDGQRKEETRGGGSQRVEKILRGTGENSGEEPRTAVVRR